LAGSSLDDIIFGSGDGAFLLLVFALAYSPASARYALNTVYCTLFAPLRCEGEAMMTWNWLWSVVSSIRPEHMVIASTALVLLTWLVLSKLRKSQRNRLQQQIGLPGQVIYADQGRHGRKFISRRYGIVAKPDFIVRLDSGENAIVEYKSRSNGALYGSDIAQVKASALAAREKMPIQKAFVLSGQRLHSIALKANSDELFEEVRALVEYAQRAASGEIIQVFCKNPRQCTTCAQKSNCQKPTKGR